MTNPPLSRTVTLLLAAAALCACHRAAPTAAGANSAAASVATQGLAKLDDYTVVYAQLIGNGGLGDVARTYASADLPHQPVNARLSLETGNLDGELAVLKRARALPASLPEIDARADTLVASLALLDAHLAALDDYYLARAYREDALARGRREDATLRAEFARAAAALQGFGGALAVERNRQDARGLADARTRGDTLTLATRQALEQAKQLVGLFTTDASLGNPTAFARADALVPTLEARLAEQHRLAMAAKKLSPAGGDSDELAGYDLAARDLTRVIGTYRELKVAPKPAGREELIQGYINALIDAHNVHRFNPA